MEIWRLFVVSCGALHSARYVQSRGYLRGIDRVPHSERRNEGRRLANHGTDFGSWVVVGLLFGSSGGGSRVDLVGDDAGQVRDVRRGATASRALRALTGGLQAGAAMTGVTRGRRRV